MKKKRLFTVPFKKWQVVFMYIALYVPWTYLIFNVYKWTQTHFRIELKWIFFALVISLFSFVITEKIQHLTANAKNEVIGALFFVLTLIFESIAGIVVIFSYTVLSCVIALPHNIIKKILECTGHNDAIEKEEEERKRVREEWEATCQKIYQQVQEEDVKEKCRRLKSAIEEHAHSLGFSNVPTKDEFNAQKRKILKSCHPDNGGSQEEFVLTSPTVKTMGF